MWVSLLTINLLIKDFKIYIKCDWALELQLKIYNPFKFRLFLIFHSKSLLSTVSIQYLLSLRTIHHTNLHIYHTLPEILNLPPILINLFPNLTGSPYLFILLFSYLPTFLLILCFLYYTQNSLAFWLLLSLTLHILLILLLKLFNLKLSIYLLNIWYLS